ncbi:MAG TPA: hypothetical protein VGE52_00275 [Pirellulales bacterium]
MKFRLPKNQTLQFLYGLLGGMLVARLITAMFARNDTIEGAFNEWLTGLIFTYIAGSIWSSLPLVAFVGIASALAFVFAVLVPTKASQAIGQNALAVFVVSSLFTIWLEPFLTNVGLATEVAKILLRLSTFMFDVGVTAAWLFAWGAGARALTVELRDLEAQGELPPFPTRIVALVVVGGFLLLMCSSCVSYQILR